MEATSSNGKRFPSSLLPSVPQPHPWLVISHGKHRQRQTFFSVSQDRRYVRTIPELRGQAIRASHNEWLVLTDFNLTECSLLNLVSMEKIQLPPMQSKKHSLCVLSSSPRSPDCKIVFFDKNRNNGSPLLVCKPGDAKFDELEVNNESFGDQGFWESAVVFNGKIYLLHPFMNLFVVDFSHPKPRIVEITLHDHSHDKVPPNIVEYSNWLVESDGELLVIKILIYGLHVKEVYGFVVHRFDFINKSWVDAKGIGKTQAIFLDSHWAKSCLATEECGIKGNSIYFVKHDNRCLYVYDVEAKTISVSLPCPDVKRPFTRANVFYSGRRGSEFHWINIPEFFHCKQPRNSNQTYFSPIEIQLAMTNMGNKCWSQLHPDILSLIHSRLFAGDLAVFNMICRSWQSAALGFRVLPPPVNSPLSLSPCLLTLYDTLCEVYHPVNNATYKLDTPELSGARICSSGYGWLLVSKGTTYSFFFNPFTKEKINLPDTIWECLKSNTAFSSPPTSPDCCVVGMHPSGFDNLTEFDTIKYGEAYWTYHDPDTGFHENGLPKKFVMCDYCRPVFFDGKWYLLGETGNIGIYDVNENSWGIYGKAWPFRKSALIRHSSLVVEKDGRGLLALFLTYEHCHVHLKRFDLSTMMWGDIESLGKDKMLYVSEGASFLETTIARGMGNKIYFPYFDRENIGVFYCLSTKTYRSFDGKYCNKSPFKLVERRSSTWIKPIYNAADVVELKWR